MRDGVRAAGHDHDGDCDSEGAHRSIIGRRRDRLVSEAYGNLASPSCCRSIATGGTMSERLLRRLPDVRISRPENSSEAMICGGVMNRILEIETPNGLARAHLHRRRGQAGLLVLGHGAGGGVGAPDLAAAHRAAASLDWSVVLVEQPYRVAGRRSPAPARQLDTAWAAVVERLRADEPGGLVPLLVVGGRSSGARVACRTQTATGAAGVLCLAFPLSPPGRTGATRLDELDAVEVPTLVVQGERDPFGLPPPGLHRTVVQVRGDHSLRADSAAVEAAVAGWLARLRP
jgi:predicted alpha/beta-hydrolase family hydrolase